MTSSCRHHNPTSRSTLLAEKEETFPIQLKNIDVIRSTLADLDVLQEKRIDDYWNVDSNRHLSNSWTGFTRFTLLKEKTLHKDIGKEFKRLPDRSCMARGLDEHW